ncbi:MAG: TIGR04283 family arsenosugar biosynthesis glycosyltransferase [Gammaproteobacteria bacterium]|nr:TIGR04283 family arsenosugar biosynthesis glycosyltransferase [Gammaproteobacteria bacterium]
MDAVDVKLSIIIPVLNEQENLSRISSHLRSIRHQGHEVIVVDGGSTDNTLAISYEVADHVIISKAGRALQMNNGAAIASGNVFVFLHADTFLPDNVVQIISASMTENSWGRFDVRLSSNRFVYRLIESLMNLRSCFTSIATGDQAMFIERSLFNRVGGFPEIVLMEDIEMSRKLKKIDRPVCIKQKVITSSRRWETRGVVATVLLMWKLRLYYFFGVTPDKLNRLYRHGLR